MTYRCYHHLADFPADPFWSITDADLARSHQAMPRGPAYARDIAAVCARAVWSTGTFDYATEFALWVWREGLDPSPARYEVSVSMAPEFTAVRAMGGTS